MLEGISAGLETAKLRFHDYARRNMTQMEGLDGRRAQQTYHGYDSVNDITDLWVQEGDVAELSNGYVAPVPNYQTGENCSTTIQLMRINGQWVPLTHVAVAGYSAYHVVIGANDATMDGFTITGGWASYSNAYDERAWGGGIFNKGVSPHFSNCLITNNYANRAGGGVFNAQREKCDTTGWEPCRPVFTNCIITHNAVLNDADWDSGGGLGGGICNVDYSILYLYHCTIGNNINPWVPDYSLPAMHYQGGGIYSFASAIIANGIILWDNTGGGINQFPSSIQPNWIVWSDIEMDGFQGGSGTGPYGTRGTTAEGWSSNNINEDPKFKDSEGGDYRLDTASLCIDAMPSAGLDRDWRFCQRPQDKDSWGGSGSDSYDMGAFEWIKGEYDSLYVIANELIADFSSLDTNFDGFLSLGEVQILYPGIDNETFDRMDFDSDGLLSPAELEILAYEKLSSVASRLYTNFGTVDTNSNGYLTWAEVHAWDASIPNQYFSLLDSESVDNRLSEDDLIFHIEGGWVGSIRSFCAEDVSYEHTCTGVVYVNKCADYYDADGTSWATAFTTIQEGIDAAYDKTSGKKEVWVATGNYVESRGNETGSLIMREGVNLFGGFEGTEEWREERDWVNNQTIINGVVARAATTYISGVETWNSKQLRTCVETGDRTDANYAVVSVPSGSLPSGWGAYSEAEFYGPFCQWDINGGYIEYLRLNPSWEVDRWGLGYSPTGKIYLRATDMTIDAGVYSFWALSYDKSWYTFGIPWKHPWDGWPDSTTVWDMDIASRHWWGDNYLPLGFSTNRNVWDMTWFQGDSSWFANEAAAPITIDEGTWSRPGGAGTVWVLTNDTTSKEAVSGEWDANPLGYYYLYGDSNPFISGRAAFYYHVEDAEYPGDGTVYQADGSWYQADLAAGAWVTIGGTWTYHTFEGDYEAESIGVTFSGRVGRTGYSERYPDGWWFLGGSGKWVSSMSSYCFDNWDIDLGGAEYYVAGDHKHGRPNYFRNSNQSHLGIYKSNGQTNGTIVYSEVAEMKCFLQNAIQWQDCGSCITNLPFHTLCMKTSTKTDLIAPKDFEWQINIDGTLIDVVYHVSEVNYGRTIWHGLTVVDLDGGRNDAKWFPYDLYQPLNRDWAYRYDPLWYCGFPMAILCCGDGVLSEYSCPSYCGDHLPQWDKECGPILPEKG